MPKLNDYLRSHGISRRALSKKTGLARVTISRLCEGRSQGRMDTWRLIAEKLGCRLEEILD